jgi:hypothetical protein
LSDCSLCVPFAGRLLPLQAQSLRPLSMSAVGAIADDQPQTSDHARIEWDSRVQRAKAKQKTGKYLLYGAAAGAGVGLLLMSQGDDFTERWAR